MSFPVALVLVIGSRGVASTAAIKKWSQTSLQTSDEFTAKVMAGCANDHCNYNSSSVKKRFRDAFERYMMNKCVLNCVLIKRKITLIM